MPNSTGIYLLEARAQIGRNKRQKPAKLLDSKPLTPGFSQQADLFFFTHPADVHRRDELEVRIGGIAGHRDLWSPYQLLAANHRKTWIMLAMQNMVKALAAAPPSREFSTGGP